MDSEARRRDGSLVREWGVGWGRGQDLGGESRLESILLKSPSRLLPGNMKIRVPVKQKECCWQETLRPAQEGFKWKYESREEMLSAGPELSKQLCSR